MSANSKQRYVKKTATKDANGKLVEATPAQIKADMLELMSKQNADKMLVKLTVASAAQLKLLIGAVEPDLMMITNLSSATFPRTFFAFVTRRSAHSTLFAKPVDTVDQKIEDIVSQFDELYKEKMKPNTPGFLYVRMVSPPSQTVPLMEALDAQFGDKIMMTQRPSASADGKETPVEWFLCLSSPHSQTLIKN